MLILKSIGWICLAGLLAIIIKLAFFTDWSGR